MAQLGQFLKDIYIPDAVLESPLTRFAKSLWNEQ